MIKLLLFTSALLGAAGTIFLFWGSFALEAPGAYMDAAMIKAMVKRNKARKLKQRLGLSLLLASFALQAIAIALGD